MSKDMKKGIRPHRFLMLFAAVFAVALMICSPLLVAVDSEAFDKAEAGYSIKIADASDVDFAPTIYSSRAEATIDNCDFFLKIFNESLYGAPTFSADKVSYTEASGEKMDGDAHIEEYAGELAATNFELILIADSSGDLINPIISEYGDAFTAAANAVKAWLGTTVSAGNVVKITGNMNVREATCNTIHFTPVDSTYFVASSGSVAKYRIQTYDVTIELQKSAEDKKSVRFTSDYKFLLSKSNTYDYGGVEYSAITSDTDLTINQTYSYNFVSGGSRYIVNDQEYAVSDAFSNEYPIHTKANLETASQCGISALFINKIANLPASTDKVVIGKEYADADAVYSDIVMGVAGEEIFKWLLIIGGVGIGVLLLIVILIVLLVLRSKKKKKQ